MPVYSSFAFEVVSGFESVQIYDDNRNGERVKIQL